MGQPEEVHVSYSQVNNKDATESPIIQKKRRLFKCNKNCGLILLGIFALCAGITTVVVWKTEVLGTYITKQFVLLNGTKAYDLWINPPIKVLNKMYLFNYTNADEFYKGKAEKLIVKEIGPFVYRQDMSKVNIEFDSNETLTYQEHRDFEYIPELSRGSLDDIVIGPNLVYLTVLGKIRHFNRVYNVPTVMFLQLYDLKAVNKPLKVKDYLWGYHDDIYKMAKSTAFYFSNELKFDKPSVMAGKNGLQKTRVTVFTGSDDLTKIDKILEVDGKRENKIWYGEECNNITGSEGTMFSTEDIKQRAKLHIYAPDICRSIPLTFEKKVAAYTLPALRYKPAEDFFSNDTCYCKPPDCPPYGVFDATNCLDAPIYLSYPHFYGASSSLTEYIDGLNPDPDSHSFYLDIHEKFGIVLGGKSRMQINIKVHRNNISSGSKIFKNDIILPIAWFDVGVDDLTEEVKNDLKLATHTATHGLMYLFLIIFIICSSIFTYCTTIGNRSRKAKPPTRDVIVNNISV